MGKASAPDSSLKGTGAFQAVARTADRPLFGRFLVADTIAKAVDKNQDMVEFQLSGLSLSLIPQISWTEVQVSYSRETLGMDFTKGSSENAQRLPVNREDALSEDCDSITVN